MKEYKDYCECGARMRHDDKFSWCSDNTRHVAWLKGEKPVYPSPAKGPGWYKHPDGFGT